MKMTNTRPIQLLGLMVGNLCAVWLSAQPLSAQQARSSIHNNTFENLPLHKCLTDHLTQQKINHQPSYLQLLEEMNHGILQSQGQATRDILTIPVVVHVIHQGGDENISNQQIFDGIQHLNDAFANTGEYFDPQGTSINIRFCLAQQNPLGNLSNGINRYESSLTNINAETQDTELKQTFGWDPNRYLNIFLVNEITSTSMGPGVAGYAFLPSSQGQIEDGIVNEARFFGSSANNSKVHIHEAGHYLGLYHTFEEACSNNNCQINGDRVCDTPPDQSTQAINCNATTNTCTSDSDDPSTNNPFRAIALGGLGDQPDQFQNYMDYGFQVCQKYFTAGQANRMLSALTTARAILLQSTVCESPCFSPITINPTASNQPILAQQPVTFFSNANGFGLQYSWLVNNQPLGSGADLSYTFPDVGMYTIQLNVTNNDINCFATQTLIVKVECPAQANFNFSGNQDFIPGNPVTTENTSVENTSNQWVLNGINSSTQTNWSQIFNTPGSHSLYLIVGNGNCLDTSSTKFFQVGNCDYSGVTDKWVFLNGGLNFSSGEPTIIASPITNLSNECTSSIADADGNLLFFTDGETLWNANYIVMPNGQNLLGCQSSSQATIITPSPGNPNQFYVFTNDCLENSLQNGLRYSLVDMTLNGGLGDVLPNFKNILVHANGSEKLSATWHANGRDIWIGTNESGTNQWYAFLIDNNGIHLNPVVSPIGEPSILSLGGMRFSNDGNRMAACMLTAQPWRILVSDFNKETGQYFNPIELPLSIEINQQPFSVAFSPDNSKLYLSTWSSGNLFQFDLSLTTANSITNSAFAVDPYEIAFYGPLVLASNGKIYVNANSGLGIDVIENPNLPGSACNYTPANSNRPIDLPSSTSFPNMLQGYFQAANPHILGPSNICKGGISYTYGISLPSANDSTVWQHTGPSVFQAVQGENTFTLTSGNQPGVDVIIATVYGRCGITFDTLEVQTNNPETTNLPDALVGCETFTLNPGNSFVYYQWQDGSTSPVYQADTAGTYTVTVKGISGCTISDTTTISIPDLVTNVSLGPDQINCNNEVVVLQTSQNYLGYTWQDGSQNATFTAFLPGIYWVTVPSGCNATVSDTISISNSPEFPLNLNVNGQDTACKSALPFVLVAPNGFVSYNWSTGATTQNLPINAIGTFVLTATDANGCSAVDSFYVVDCITGFNKQAEQSAFTIFPNPAKNEIQLIFPNPTSATIEVYDAVGKLCATQQIDSSKQANLQVSHLAIGVYLVKVSTAQYSQVRRLVKN